MLPRSRIYCFSLTQEPFAVATDDGGKEMKSDCMCISAFLICVRSSRFVFTDYIA